MICDPIPLMRASGGILTACVAFNRMILCSLNEKVKHLSWASQVLIRRIGDEGKHEKND